MLTGAGLHGLFRVAAYEYPQLTVGSIELAPDTPPEAVLEQLLDDLTDRSLPVTEIAWRHGCRHIARVQPGADTTTPLPATPGNPVRPRAAYLVTGGLGGLGPLAAAWLAAQGAGRIVVNGRTAPSAQAQAALEQARAHGAEVIVVRGDLADPTTTSQLVDAATDGGRDLRGVVHAAAVVEDATIGNLDSTLLERVWRGKAEGAWALHQATHGHDLDFFVCYSSVAALLGSPGQAAYAAANAFVDDLIAWRASQGLPATGIWWGPWSEVGRGQHMAQRGFATITPADGTDALHRILHSGLGQVAYSPIALQQWIADYPHLQDATLLSALLSGQPAEDNADETARQEVLTATDDLTRRQRVEAFLIEQVRDLLGGTTRHIGPHTSLVTLGLDSLGALRLQQRIARTFKTDLKPGVIWTKPTSASVAEVLLEQMGLAPATDTLQQQKADR
ncbi:beta-ketoacyl reductase [Streptomyces sp. KLMMK]|uniref:beta-ketoacyl reductase n=1 Tax=Streptomyces sp. KLMMK TaxID=3109353 RepID=UPI00300A55EF